MCYCTPEIRTPFCGKPECAVPRNELINEADKEFGHSPRYWYALLAIAIRNQEATEKIIQRIIDCARK